MDGSIENRPVFQPDGSVAVPAFVLPVSGLLSEEATAFQRQRAATPPFDAVGQEADIALRREQINAYAAQAIPRLRDMFAVGIVPATIVGESMGHCYYNNLAIPEARDADAAIVAFFSENLA